MPYQNWYSAATNAAVDMNMPPALVPPFNSVVAPVRQPITPINANVPSADVTTQNENNLNIQNRDRSNYARNLRTAGRFDRETAMITPQETQRMMYGDQAFRNTRRITEEREKSKLNWGWFDKDGITRSQEDMMLDAGPGTWGDDVVGAYGITNASNPFSNRYSSLWS